MAEREQIYRITNSGKVIPVGELVRCKDCRHYAETQQGVQRRNPFVRYVCDDFNPPDNFFCADGERKDGEHE